jgi:uncharacterized protein
MIADILQFGARNMADRGAHKLNLVLFGGEPTLYLKQCVNLLDGGQRLGMVSSRMITNGTLLRPKAVAALEQAGLGSVQATLDGDASVHDTLRVTHAGRGTFEQIMRNLEHAASLTDMRWMLTVNLTGHSIDTADALLARLSDELPTSKFYIKFALVFDYGVGFEDGMRPSPELARRVSGLYIAALEQGFRVPPVHLKNCLACDVVGGATGAVINADGTLYSCWGSAGKHGYEVGSIHEGYIGEELLRSRWVSCGFDAATDTRYPNRPAGDHPPNVITYWDIIFADILDWAYERDQLNPIADNGTLRKGSS